MSLKIKEAFEPVRADEEMKEATKKLLRNTHQRHPGRPPRFWWFKILKPAAAVMILAVVLMGSIKVYDIEAEAAYITMDGDVQIGLSVDQNEQVIAAEGLNEKGDSVLEEVAVEGVNYQEAFERIMTCDAYRQTQDTEVQISVSSHDEAYQESLQSGAEETCHQYQRRYRGGQTEEESGADQSQEQDEDTGNHGHGSRHQKGRQ